MKKILIIISILSLVSSAASQKKADDIKISFSTSSVFFLSGFYMHSGYDYDFTQYKEGSLQRKDLILKLASNNGCLELGYCWYGGDFRIGIDVEGGSGWGEEYPKILGNQVWGISEISFQSIYFGFRPHWITNARPRTVFHMPLRLGYGSEKYSANEDAMLTNAPKPYKSNGLYWEMASGADFEYELLEIGIIIGWCGITNSITSDFGDMNIYGGLNVGLNLSSIGDGLESIRKKSNKPKSKYSNRIYASRDDSKPKIQIEEPDFSNNVYRTEEPIVIVRGTAKDKEGLAFIKINDKNAKIQDDGSFLYRLRVEYGKTEVKIKAIDVNDNYTVETLYVIREDSKYVDDIADVDFAPKSKTKNQDAIAVVIGIEDYQYAPTVQFAYNDADIFRQYLIHTFGIPKENIYFKTNERATKGEFEKIFSENGWISRRAVPGKTKVFVFYAGHGAPDLETQRPYLIPYDIDPNYAHTGFLLEDIYKSLGSLEVESIMMFIDACFSGATREGEALLADARPVNISVENPVIASNMYIFTSASGNQISSAYSEKQHGLFSYFLLKGLSGEADLNKDNDITVEELYNYISVNVSETGGFLDREQNPLLLPRLDNIGDRKNMVIIKY